MSSRQLRKIQKLKALEKPQDVSAQDSPDESEDDSPAPVASKPRVSLFAALGGDDDNEAPDDDDDDDDEGPEVKAAGGDESVQDAQPSTAAKSKKKKKKKKKTKAGAAAADAPAISSGQDVDDDDDEIDRAIKELNISTRQDTGDADAHSAGAPSRRAAELLSVNPYHLKAVNEMRNLFGRDIITSAEAEEQEQERTRHRRAPAQRQVDLETFLRSPPGAKKLPEVSLRRNIFIQGREHWPRQTAGGLTMKEIRKAPDGAWTEYAYVHDKDYDAVQAFFFACVQIGDPMRMVHLLREVPYHVSTLLQVSSVAKQDQNMALAAELCERALFTFGRVTTSAFRQNVEQGRARLDFRRPENRQFWLAGYHYLKSLIRKGTYRTALEWAKLLYALDPMDPYAMRHFIHFLAIRARESRWLIDFFEELESSIVRGDSIYLQQTLVLAKLQLGDADAAKADLVAGMQRVPWLYCALFQELNLDTPPSIWGINADSDERSFWQKLYIYQTKDLWNNTQAISLLQTVAKSIDKVDTSTLASNEAPADLGATRLAYLEGQTSLLTVAPRHLLDSQPNYEFDPLPPAEEDNIFTGEGTRMPWVEQQRRSETQPSDIEARMRNMFARNAGPAAPGIVGAADSDDDLAGLDIDDEELRRDIEEQARQGNGAGLMATLMQLLGGRDSTAGDTAGNTAGEVNYDHPGEEVEAALPGAWPEEEDEVDGRNPGADAQR